MDANLKINFYKNIGEIRALNGVNLAPKLHNQKNRNMNEAYRALKIPYARLHDVPLDNPGMRLVDIQHIFGNREADENDPRNYYFKQTDDYIRNCLGLGTQVVYRLGTSIEHSLQNYYAFPPEDFDRWITVCINIIRHYNEGWANGYSWKIVYWEIWNEPNAKPHMWSGDDKLYYELYARAAKRIKERFSYVKVGGPALSCPVQYDAPLKYTDDFLEYCRKENAPLDFYSWHCYPTCLEEIVDEPARVRKVLDRFGFTETELHLNEWHYAPTWEYSAKARARLSDAESAAFTTAVLTSWQDSPLTMGGFYTASVIWGIYDAYGVFLKTYYALHAFARMLEHPRRVEAVSPEKNVTVLAGMDADGKAAVLVSAYRSPAKTIRLEMKGAEERRFRISCLDESGDAPFDCGEEDGGLISLDLKSESAIFLLTEV